MNCSTAVEAFVASWRGEKLLVGDWRQAREEGRGGGCSLSEEQLELVRLLALALPLELELAFSWQV